MFAYYKYYTYLCIVNEKEIILLKGKGKTLEYGFHYVLYENVNFI